MEVKVHNKQNLEIAIQKGYNDFFSIKNDSDMSNIINMFRLMGL